MSNKNDDLMPLYYAIIKHFEDGKADCAQGVMNALEGSYGSYKLFTEKDVEESLATAKENGLLDECDWQIDEHDHLRVFYRANDFGKDMIKKYLQ